MDDYPLLNLFLTMLYLFLWVMWFFLLFKVVTDLFRDHTLNGWAKAGWLIFVILLPYLGVLIYLIVRGRSMHERDAKAVKDSEAAFRQYVREAANSGGSSGSTSHVSDLAKLAELKDKGALNAEEYERAKAKLLA
ncbi:SHOCT domain-containing protein [Streptomyces sp. NPDC012389]|uniref:SHOCT domain-containing protein n=1 Tax=unclassified Streptomyces TaxID=2593676 RepID=UPI00081E8E9D|nr:MULTISPECIES: SHOCT domain-containing protein [unclassified Streptomyces]MYR94434.1 SHOCT domain-containing protein [Streptomyces sp. SID4937]SCD71499.1 Phospholipase_D-nuclease N-terminal [Streptomyces sp. ScaeMP-e83]